MHTLEEFSLGRHVSHTLPTTAAVVTVQAAQRTGDSDMWLHCPEGLTSE